MVRTQEGGLFFFSGSIEILEVFLKVFILVMRIADGLGESNMILNSKDLFPYPSHGQ